MHKNDPLNASYEPFFSDPRLEAERLERCLQQQVEDLFTTMSRIRSTVTAEDIPRWDTLRGGLRCWRMAVRESGS